MATLYKRAATNPFMAAVLKVVEGQVRDAMLAHKEWNLPEKAARSIAKRITGDVVANWSRLDALRAALTRDAE